MRRNDKETQNKADSLNVRLEESSGNKFIDAIGEVMSSFVPRSEETVRVFVYQSAGFVRKSFEVEAKTLCIEDLV